MILSIWSKEKNLNLFLIAVISITIAILLVISNRGFDFTDEGLYAIFANPLQEIRYSPTNYDIFFKLVYKYFNYTFDIRGLRILRIILTIAGSGFFFLGITKLTDKLGIHFASKISQLLFIICIGFFSGYHILIQTPGYNDFSLIGVKIFAGSFLALLLTPKLHTYKCVFYLASSFAGFLILFLTKPTGTPFILLFSCVLLFFDFSKKVITRFFVTWFLIAVLIIFFPIAANVSLSSYWDTYLVFNRNSNTHSFSQLFLNLSFGVSILVIAFLLGVAAYHYVVAKKMHPLILLLIAILICIIVTADYKRAFRLYSSDRDFTSIYLFSRINYLLAILFGFFYGVSVCKNGIKNNIKSDKKFLLIYVMPLTLFLAVFFGTNGAFLNIFPTSFQFFVISFYLLVPVRKINLIIAAFVTVLFCKLVFTFFLLRPFNQESIVSQKIPFQYGGKLDSRIYLDSFSFNCQTVFNKQVSKFKTEYIVGFNNLAGYIYLAGKVYPGSILWGDEDLANFFDYKFTYPESFILAMRQEQKHKLMPYLEKYHIELYALEIFKVSPKVVIPISFFQCTKVR